MTDKREIIEALAHYVRALEERDGDAIAALFAPDGEFEVFGRDGVNGYAASGIRVVGRDKIRAMIENGSLPPGRGMHYLTTDHIVEINGDEATMDAQFVAVESNTGVASDHDWTTAAKMLRGSLALSMVGRYDSQLQRVHGRWVFTTHRVKHNLPLAIQAPA
jgi:hypothetical protein